MRRRGDLLTPYSVASLPHHGTEVVEQSRGVKSLLPGVFVDVESSALRAGNSAAVALINDGGDVVMVQDASEHQAGGSCSDDGYSGCSCSHVFHVVTETGVSEMFCEAVGVDR